MGKGSDESVVHECGGVGGVGEEEDGVVEIAGGGGCTEIEEATGGDGVAGEAGFDELGVELEEGFHGGALGF